MSRPRATHCKRGHSLHDAFITPKGGQDCRECHRIRGALARRGLYINSVTEYPARVPKKTHLPRQPSQTYHAIYMREYRQGLRRKRPYEYPDPQQIVETKEHFLKLEESLYDVSHLRNR